MYLFNLVLSSYIVTVVCYSVIIGANLDVNILNATFIYHTDSPDVHLITDKEADNFGLTLATVQSYFRSKGYPETLYNVVYKDPVYYKGERIWIYKSKQMYRIEPVRTSVRIVNATVQEVTSRPEIVATQVCHNRRSNSTIKCKFALTAKRTNSVTTTWTTSLGVTSEASITIGVEDMFGVGGRLEVRAGWEGSAGSQLTTELGTELGGETTVAPLQAVHVQLVSSVGKMRAQLQYEATVSGYVYYCVPDVGIMGNSVEELLEHIGRNTTVRGTMMVDVKVYSKASLTVHDAETGEPINLP